MSLREGLLSAIRAALGGAGAPADLSVLRNPLRAWTAEDGAVAGVFALSEQVDYEDANTPSVQRLLTFGVAVRVPVTSEDAPDTALDPYLAWVVEALLTDPTLGGACIRTRELSTEWVAEELDETYAGALVTFEALYLTHEADLSAAA